MQPISGSTFYSGIDIGREKQTAGTKFALLTDFDAFEDQFYSNNTNSSFFLLLFFPSQLVVLIVSRNIIGGSSHNR
jgi:hypothetical protein